MTTIKDFKLGADPEFFVKQGDKFVSAYGLIKGTKHNPYIVERGAVQVDGMALEFNIDAATKTDEFNLNIVSVLQQLRKMVPDNLSFAYVSVAPFGYDYIQSQPEEAKKLGCTPDFNAYTGEENPSPDAETPFRTASGHIHIGWTDGMDIEDPEHLEACRMMVKQLDVCLGTASVVWDTDNTRRELYGKAGAFRPKHYGVEYRVMSNAWLNTPWQRMMVFEFARMAFKDLLAGHQYFAKTNVEDVINSGDVRSCYKILANRWLVNNELSSLYQTWDAANKIKQNRDELGRWVKADAKVKGKKAVAG